MDNIYVSASGDIFVKKVIAIREYIRSFEEMIIPQGSEDESYWLAAISYLEEEQIVTMKRFGTPGKKHYLVERWKEKT